MITLQHLIQKRILICSRIKSEKLQVSEQVLYLIKPRPLTLPAFAARNLTAVTFPYSNPIFY